MFEGIQIKGLVRMPGRLENWKHTVEFARGSIHWIGWVLPQELATIDHKYATCHKAAGFARQIERQWSDFFWATPTPHGMLSAISPSNSGRSVIQR